MIPPRGAAGVEEQFGVAGWRPGAERDKLRGEETTRKVPDSRAELSSLFGLIVICGVLIALQRQYFTHLTLVKIYLQRRWVWVLG
jgi:hypothetical protein